MQIIAAVLIHLFGILYPNATMLFGTNYTVSGGGGGPVALDNCVASTPATTATQSVNLTLSAGDTNVFLAVDLAINDAGTAANISSGPTYNGTSMTGQVVDFTVTGQRHIQYFLVNPTHDGAAHSLTATLTGAPTAGWVLVGCGFSGANQSATYNGQHATANGNSATASVALTSLTANDYVLESAVWAGGQTGTIGDGSTSIVNNTTDGLGASYKANPGASYTASWTIGAGGSIWSIAAMEIRP